MTPSSAFFLLTKWPCIFKMVKAEWTILNALNHRIFLPTRASFLFHYLSHVNATQELSTMAYFLIDATLQTHSMLPYLPSHIAAGVIFIIDSMTPNDSFNITSFLHSFGHKKHLILKVAKAILYHFRMDIKSQKWQLQALTKKYENHSSLINTYLLEI